MATTMMHSSQNDNDDGNDEARASAVMMMVTIFNGDGDKDDYHYNCIQCSFPERHPLLADKWAECAHLIISFNPDHEQNRFDKNLFFSDLISR